MLRAAVARGDSRRRHHGRRDGERLADSRALDDVHRGCVRVLRSQGALRRSGPGPDRPHIRRAGDRHRLRVALRAPRHFRVAVQYAFSGYAALSPLLFAALFWRRSTKWGALAATLWVAVSVSGVAILQTVVTKPGPVLVMNGVERVTRTPAGTLFLGYLPVVPMTLISALLIVVVSLGTKPPGKAVVERYFPARS